MAGVAVNVTDVPGQKGFGVAAMVIPAGSNGVAAMAMEFDIPGFPDTHISEDVRIQDTRSPATGL